jgi:putative oxygen-independent coproporphyrinogen III oxidase
MSGIYIHIPFCRKACRYCDFYFSVSLHYMDQFVDALVEEIRIKGELNPGMSLDTLYLGGGTPSVLSASNMEKILEAILLHYSFRANPEWTVECNPDDLNGSTLKNLKQAGFNRLSIGIQSFQERDLLMMRRSHSAEQGEKAVRQAAEAGFSNISIDLIYGIPGQPLGEWEENIHKTLLLPISHISAYHLTFEPGTVFDHWRKKGRLAPVAEEESVEKFRILRKTLLPAGFNHYELSNFAKEGCMSEHNMLYWSGLPYQGFGPSAHSFDGKQRSWNISSLKAYMKGVVAGKKISESEKLSTMEQYHDYLITSLRTRWGADPEYIEKQFGAFIRKHFEKEARVFMLAGSMYRTEGKLAIDPDHWLITDHILRALFMD